MRLKSTDLTIINGRCRICYSMDHKMRSVAFVAHAGLNFMTLPICEHCARTIAEAFDEASQS